MGGHGRAKADRAPHSEQATHVRRESRSPGNERAKGVWGDMGGRRPTGPPIRNKRRTSGESRGRTAMSVPRGYGGTWAGEGRPGPPFGTSDARPARVAV